MLPTFAINYCWEHSALILSPLLSPPVSPHAARKKQKYHPSLDIGFLT